MDVSAAVDRFRALEEDGFVDACEIREPDSETFDGSYTPAQGALIYSGPCRYKDNPSEDPTPDTGEAEVTLRRGIVVVPWTVTGVAKNQRVTLTATKDGQLDGAEFRVTEVATDSWLVTRHLAVEMPLERSTPEVTDAS